MVDFLLLAVLDVLYLAVDDGSELLVGGARHFVASLLEQRLPQLQLFILLHPQLFVDLLGDFFGLNIPVSLNTIGSLLLPLLLLYQPSSGPGSLVEEEGPLDLILPLLVSRGSRLDRHIPPVVVNVSRVAASVRGLRVRLCYQFIREALLYEEALVLVLQILEVASNLEVGSGMDSGQRNRRVPLRSLGSEEIPVDLALHHRLDELSLGVHVHLSVEEGVLVGVVDLSVLNAANSLAHVGSVAETYATRSERLSSAQDVLASSRKQVPSLRLLHGRDA